MLYNLPNKMYNFNKKGVVYIKFFTYEQNKQEHVGLLCATEKSILPIKNIIPISTTMIDLIRNITDEQLQELNKYLNNPENEKYAIPLDSVKILSPIPNPAHDIICVGLNYSEHIKEFSRTPEELNADTSYFSKRAIHIIGDGDVINARFDLDTNLDYESELAIIIGKDGIDISEQDAEDYIFGYSVFNDISSRILQRKHLQWYRGKSLDTYSAMGPCIVHKSALKLPLSLAIKSIVNGELRQNSNTSQMIKSVSKIISEISTGMTLKAGDIIATGTPSGVAMGMPNKPFLKDGDTVTCEIENIGSLTNNVTTYSKKQ